MPSGAVLLSYPSEIQHRVTVALITKLVRVRGVLPRHLDICVLDRFVTSFKQTRKKEKKKTMIFYSVENSTKLSGNTCSPYKSKN